MRHDVYFHFADQGIPEAIVSTLKALLSQGRQIMALLDTLTAQVKANTDAEQSAVVLITKIAAMLEAAKTDPVAVQALADQLKASADSLGAAVVQNTPAA